MKVFLEDDDGNEVVVGYMDIPDEDGIDSPLFWIDTPYESVTLKMSRKQMTQLVSAITFLKDNK